MADELLGKAEQFSQFNEHRLCVIVGDFSERLPALYLGLDELV